MTLTADGVDDSWLFLELHLCCKRSLAMVASRPLTTDACQKFLGCCHSWTPPSRRPPHQYVAVLQLALLTLETRTAFTEEESVTRGLTGETADAFAAAISDGLTALVTSPAMTKPGQSPQHLPQQLPTTNQSAADVLNSEDAQQPGAVDLHSPAVKRDPDPMGSCSTAAALQLATDRRQYASELTSRPAASVQKEAGSAAAAAVKGAAFLTLKSTISSKVDDGGGLWAPGRAGCEGGALIMGICTGMQCLQSLAARERAFRLAPDSAARMAHLPWQLLQARYGCQLPRSQAISEFCCHVADQVKISDGHLALTLGSHFLLWPSRLLPSEVRRAAPEATSLSTSLPLRLAWQTHV